MYCITKLSSTYLFYNLDGFSTVLIGTKMKSANIIGCNALPVPSVMFLTCSMKSCVFCMLCGDLPTKS